MSYKSCLPLIVTTSLILLFIIPGTKSFAEIKVFEKEIEEIVGKNQSQEQVEAFALQKAKRLAVEEAGTYISSLTIIKNYKLAKDEITALASGVVQAKIVGYETFEANDRSTRTHSIVTHDGLLIYIVYSLINNKNRESKDGCNGSFQKISSYQTKQIRSLLNISPKP